MAALRIAANLLATLLVGGCVPTTAAYLHIPVELDDGVRCDQARLNVPLAELRQRMAGFDLDSLAFYHRGRDPIPYRLLDDDGDGKPDSAEVCLPIGAAGTNTSSSSSSNSSSSSSQLIALCPGPRASGQVPVGGTHQGVRLRFDLARR